MKRILGLFCTLLLLITMLLPGCAKNANSPAEAATPTPELTPAPTPVVTPAPLPTPVVFPTKGYCNGEGVNLRKIPDTKGAIVDIMGENAVLDVRALANEWYQVNLGGETAYVSEKLVTLGEPPRKDNMCYGRIIVASAALYLSPAEEDVSEKSLAEGDILKILRALGDYLHIVYDAPEDGVVQRYVHKDDVLYIPIEEYLAARDALADTPLPEDDALPEDE